MIPGAVEIKFREEKDSKQDHVTPVSKNTLIVPWSNPSHIMEKLI